MNRSVHPFYLAFIGFLVLTIVMGIGRFAYTPILPYMEQYHLSSFQAGFLATMNYTGYFIGAFLARNVRKDPYLLSWIIIGNIITTLLMGVTYSLVLWSALRLLSGLTSGIAFVLVSSIILHYLKQTSRSSLSGFLYGGVGFGIFLSGILIPSFLAMFGVWESAWIGLAVVSFILFLIIVSGLSKMEKPIPQQVKRINEGNDDKRNEKRKAFSLYISYFCEGFGYIIFATFIISMLVSTTQLEWPTSYVWAIVGIGAVPSCLFWAWVGSRLTVVGALKIAFLIQIGGVLLPIFATHSFFISLSALSFGGTFMGITMLTLMSANELFPETSQQMIGGLTAVYGIGQMLGPLFAGLFISDHDYRFAFCLAVVLLFIGFISLHIINKEEVHEHAIR